MCAPQNNSKKPPAAQMEVLSGHGIQNLKDLDLMVQGCMLSALEALPIVYMENAIVKQIFDLPSPSNFPVS